MSAESRKRAQRRRNFAIRKRDQPEDVRKHKEGEWEYIMVHPASDETELLSKLEMKPSDCTCVDCYWSIDGDVVFLRVTTTLDWPMAPGLYGYRKPWDFEMAHLAAVTTTRDIACADIERAMSAFSKIKHEFLKRGRLPVKGNRLLAPYTG